MMRMALIIMMMVWVVVGCRDSNMGSRFYYLENEKVEYETDVVPIYIDILFNEKEMGIIEVGIIQWNYTLNGYRKMEIVSKDFDMSIERIKEAEDRGGYIILKIGKESILIKEEAGSKTLGFTNGIGGNKLYLIPENMNEGEMYGVVLHEVGHLLGARHNEEGLMSPNYNKLGFRCIDKGAVRSVGEHFGYEWGRMNYCIMK